MIIFQPSGMRGFIQSNKTLLEAAKDLGVPLESACGGEGWCGRCKIIIEKGMGNLTRLTDAEKKLLLDSELKSNYRLACFCRIKGNVIVTVPEISKRSVQVVRKDVREIPVKLKPSVRKYYLEIDPPTLDDSKGDLERLLHALEKQYRLRDLSIGYLILKDLPDVLRKGEWKVTVSVWRSKEIIHVEAGCKESTYGVAVDIGTTTVAGYLMNLSTGEVVAVDSMMNPQVSYGEDVMSRISYIITNPDGLVKLNKKIIDGVNLILSHTARAAGISLHDIQEVTVVGNTCMHHIFLNLNPKYVGVSPFTPVVHHSVDVKAKDLGLNMLGAGNIHLLPNEAGFVGADNVGVLLATEPWKWNDVGLIIDIGTNGELVLGNRDRLVSCSCATGPALEGAHIKHGMRAAPGAIEKVEIEPSTFEVNYSTIGGEDPRGLCGSGIIQTAAELFKAGIFLKSGVFNKDLKSPKIRKGTEGYEFVLVSKEETSVGIDITITQSDIRAIQLAKGAMYAGAKVLMNRYGVKEIDQVILAGAFGTYIDKKAAMLIGLFPDCQLDKVVAVGNAAGDGARLALLNEKKRDEADKISKQVQYIELSLDPSFEKEFVEAMYFPHMKDSFPHLQDDLRKIPPQ
jgi:uncharacterized 2Fe-2S/4Fe-4S cluster protein (DUF4445 family)